MSYVLSHRPHFLPDPHKTLIGVGTSLTRAYRQPQNSKNDTDKFQGETVLAMDESNSITTPFERNSVTHTWTQTWA